MINLRLIALFLLLCFVMSCGPNSIQYVNGSLDNAFMAARTANKKLLLIVFMPGCESCQILTETLEKDRDAKTFFGRDYLIYKCSINQVGNEYIAQAAYSIASPTCYAFNEKGILSQIVVGNTGPKRLIASLTHVDSVATNKGGYKIGLEGKEYIDLLNTMLQTRSLLQTKNTNKQQLTDALDTLKQTLLHHRYFYNYYLAARLSHKLGLKQEAKNYAEAALNDDNDFSIFLYRELRKEMKFLTGVCISEILSIPVRSKLFSRHYGFIV